MKKVLITGANGLLGHDLCKKLNRSGFNITAITRKIGNYSKDKTWNQVEIDFNTQWSTDQLPKRVDVIIHLSQSSSFNDFPSKSLDIFNVNISSTAQILDYALKAGAKHFIYASSGGIYRKSNQLLSENSEISNGNDSGYYITSKICSETLCKCYSKFMRISIIRPFFIYGYRQSMNMLIPRLIICIKDGKKISLNKKNGIKVNPIHVSDASESIKSIIINNPKSDIFNLAGPEVLSIRKISEYIGNTLQKEPNFEHIDNSQNDIVANIDLMTKELHVNKIKFSEIHPEFIEYFMKFHKL